MKKTSSIYLLIFSFLVLFFIIWKTNSYIINGTEELYLKGLIDYNILSPDYEFFFQGNEEDRKFFRYFGVYFKSYIYFKINFILVNLKLNTNLLIYVHYSLISLSLTGGIFFTLKCVEKICKQNIYTVWIYIISTVSYIIVVGKVNDSFSHYEFFFLSACLFFSMQKKIFFFLLFSVFAIFNRETGILASSIFFLLNQKNFKTLFISTLPLFFFLLFNYNFFIKYPYNINDILFVSSHLSRPNLIDIFDLDFKKSIGYLSYTLLIYCPLIYCFKDYKIFINKNHNYLFFLFLIIVMFGTFLGNIYPHLIIIPFMSVIFFEKKLKNT